MGVLCYLALQEDGINGVKWWGMDVEDHCPLGHCPTAKGIVVDGCPHELYKAKIEARSVRIENPGKGGFFGTGIEQGWRVQLQEVMTVGRVGKVVVQGPTEVHIRGR
ncbi:hypothetical protein ACLOJK_023082 [Asimina triloba]